MSNEIENYDWDDSKILVSVEGVRYFLESQGEDENREIADEEIKNFAVYLDIDVFDWMKENYRTFREIGFERSVLK